VWKSFSLPLFFSPVESELWIPLIYEESDKKQNRQLHYLTRREDLYTSFLPMDQSNSCDDNDLSEMWQELYFWLHFYQV
jgi:hypothetical protein